jgi:hypothetical protein
MKPHRKKEATINFEKGTDNFTSLSQSTAKR